jgi:predicted transposase/invertase (TIGR01784 family)
MQTILLSPKVDFVFKKIFGSEKHPEILISFLNAVLKPKFPINKVNLKNTDIDKDYIKDKFSRLDVKATTSNNEIINIEIQLKNEHDMIQRSLYYWSKLYEEQLKESETYNKLCRTVCINILNFKYLDNERFHNRYRLKEVDTNEELTDLEEIHFIEIPKLKKIDVEKDTVDMLEAWISFLKDPESEIVRKFELTNSQLREAKDELYRLSRDEKEREFYFLREKALKDEISALAGAKEEGRIEGRIEGEKLKALEIAKNMLKNNIDEKIIEVSTGITIEEIRRLKN